VRNALPWQPEASYVVPCAAKDSLPHASEGNRMLALKLPGFENLLDDSGCHMSFENLLDDSLYTWLIMS